MSGVETVGWLSRSSSDNRKSACRLNAHKSDEQNILVVEFAVVTKLASLIKNLAVRLLMDEIRRSPRDV